MKMSFFFKCEQNERQNTDKMRIKYEIKMCIKWAKKRGLLSKFGVWHIYIYIYIMKKIIRLHFFVKNWIYAGNSCQSLRY